MGIIKSYKKQIKCVHRLSASFASSAVDVQIWLQYVLGVVL